MTKIKVKTEIATLNFQSLHNRIQLKTLKAIPQVNRQGTSPSEERKPAILVDKQIEGHRQDLKPPGLAIWRKIGRFRRSNRRKERKDGARVGL